MTLPLQRGNPADQQKARGIIHKLGESGTPPERGASLFTVGLDPYLNVLREDYFDIAQSTFKLVVGNYGGGKTHLFYNVRDLAWRSNFVVSYVVLNPRECPFDQLELVYRAIVSQLVRPLTTDDELTNDERGIEPLLRAWAEGLKAQLELGDDLNPAAIKKLDDYLAHNLRSIESGSFQSAIRHATIAAALDDLDKLDVLLQWLKAEGYDAKAHGAFRIKEKIDKKSALRMIRSLTQWIHLAGYAGTVLLFDEGDRLLSLSSAKSKSQVLDNLREIVDEVGSGKIPGTMMFYAVPDANQLLEGNGPTYEALKQRLRPTYFDRMNPTGVRISLDDDKLQIKPEQFLLEVGLKIAGIYEIAYNVDLDKSTVNSALLNLASAAYRQKYVEVGYRRLFVSSSIQLLNHLRHEPRKAITPELANQIVTGRIDALKSTHAAEADDDEG